MPAYRSGVVENLESVFFVFLKKNVIFVAMSENICIFADWYVGMKIHVLC